MKSFSLHKYLLLGGAFLLTATACQCQKKAEESKSPAAQPPEQKKTSGSEDHPESQDTGQQTGVLPLTPAAGGISAQETEVKIVLPEEVVVSEEETAPLAAIEEKAEEIAEPFVGASLESSQAVTEAQPLRVEPEEATPSVGVESSQTEPAAS